VESKNTPLAIGGAALAALLLAPLGTRLVTPTSNPGSPPLQIQPSKSSEAPLTASGVSRLLRDDSGPWYAICQEFASPQPDGGELQLHPSPTTLQPDSPVLPADAEPTEVTEHTNDNVTTKYSVKQHPLRDITGCLPQNHSEPLLFMLVGVADPASSHLQLDTDRTLDSIQRAAGTFDYAFERFWLPWQEPNPGLPSLATRELKLRQEQPGLMIFTKHGGAKGKGSVPNGFEEDTHLLVFLHGESPTFGADRLQLQNALRYIAQLSSKSSYPSAPVGYVSAYFSSSYPSIAEILESQNALGLHRIAMVNGISSDDDLINAFENKLADMERQPNGSLTRLLFFDSLEMRSSKIIDKAINTANSLGYDDREIAVLSEDQSAYGAGVSNPCEISSRDCQQMEADEDKKHGVVNMKFPRDLSALRNVAEQGIAPDELGGIPLPTLGIPLTLHEQGSIMHDSQPSFAPDQSAARIDRALQAMVRRIRLQRIAFVVLTSSNVLDSIYLLDYLHRAIPDVRLAVVGGDEFMLGRPRYVDFSGTLSISGLPVLADHEVQVYNDLDPRKQPNRSLDLDFPSSAAEGVYLAMANLLATEVGPDAERHAISSRKHSDCAEIAVVGRNGFNLVRDAESPQYYPCRGSDWVRVARKSGGHLKVPWIWTVGLLMLLFATTLHLLVIVASTQRFPPLRPFYSQIYVLLTDSPLHGMKQFFFFALNNQIILMEAMAVTVTLTLHGYLLKTQWVLLALHCLLLPSVLYVAFIRGRDLINEHIRQRRTQRELRSGFGIVTFFSSVVFVPWTLYMWLRLLSDGEPLRKWSLDTAIALRNVSLGDGVSPLASIFAILAAYSLWALNNMRRLSFVETRRSRLSFPCVCKSRTILEVRRLRKSISDAILVSVGVTPVTMAAMAATGAAFILFRIWYGLRGIDSEPFILFGRVDLWGFRSWMVIWGFAALVMTVILSAGRVWEVWTAVKRLTHFLEQTPLRHAFDSVPKELSALQIWHIGGARKSYVLQSRTVELLRRIEWDQPQPMKAFRASATLGSSPTSARKPSAAVTDVRSCAEHSQELLLRLQRDDTANWSTQYIDVKELGQALNCYMGRAAHYLYEVQPESAKKTIPSGALSHESASPHKQRRGADNERDDAKLVANPTELYLAYRFLALFRYSLLQIRNMLWFLVYGYACLLISIAVYPFEGRRSLGGLLTLLFIILLGGVAVLMLQIGRDPILSRVDHPTGTLGNFLQITSNLVTVGGLPLIVVLASQFPGTADFLFSWIRPLIGSGH
jgi:hypothetical protein